MSQRCAGCQKPKINPDTNQSRGGLYACTAHHLPDCNCTGVVGDWLCTACLFEAAARRRHQRKEQDAKTAKH